MKKYLTILFFALTTIINWTQAQGKAVSEITAVNKPNIILFLVDDMATADVKYMPTLSKLALAGVQFTQFVSPTPVCAQSRTSILRGQYSHNTYQLGKIGFEHFYLMGLEKETVAVWLQRAGYATGLFGKYINGYMQSSLVSKSYFPPGWSEWYAGYRLAGYNYTLNKNGVLTEYKEPGPHINDELARLAVGFIDRHHNEPMFLYIASPSPHTPTIPAHRHENSYKATRLPQDASFNEEDVSDKPAYVQRFPERPANEPNRLEGFRKRLRTLRSVEDLIKTVTAALVKHGVRDNTYFVFVSDNGWQYGQHRLANGKITPYQASNIVPAWIWGPGIPAGVSRDNLVANSDLAQTFAEWAGAEVPDFVDGRSLVPVLRNVPTPISDWRQAIPLAFEQDLYRPWPAANSWPPSYFGLLTASEKYTRYVTLEEELYLHDSDPYDMESQHKNPLWAGKKRGMLHWAQHLGSCKGESCRKFDKAPSLN